MGLVHRLSMKNSGCFSCGSAKILEMLSSPAIDGKLPPSADTGMASTRPPKPRPSTVTIEGVLGRGMVKSTRCREKNTKGKAKKAIHPFIIGGK